MAESTITAISTRRYSSVRHFVDVLRSEFCKICSLRSTFWTLLAVFTFNIVFAAVAAVFLPGHLSDKEKMTIDATRLSLAGLHLSLIAIAVLGVLVIAGEYGTGMIRTSLTAVPQRRLMLAAKVIVFTSVSLLVGFVSCIAAYFTFQLLVGSNSGLATSISDPGVLRAVAGGGLFLTAIGLLGLGLGAATRSAAAAIAIMLGALFVPSILIGLLPSSWNSTINPYIPMEAGRQIFCVHHDPGSLGPWTGFGVFCLYGLVTLIVGFIVIQRRDA